MHELSVTQGIVNIVVDEAKKSNAKKVTNVKVTMGKCTCLVPEIVVDYFSLMCEGTCAEGAKLSIERTPGKVKCNDCNKTSVIPDFRIVCPECGSRNTELVAGKEFYIDSIEIEE